MARAQQERTGAGSEGSRGGGREAVQQEAGEGLLQGVRGVIDEICVRVLRRLHQVAVLRAHAGTPLSVVFCICDEKPQISAAPGRLRPCDPFSSHSQNYTAIRTTTIATAQKACRG